MPYNKKESLIECDCCYRQYDYLISENQANGCASELITEPKDNKRFVYSSYGSQYDTYKFLVKENSHLMTKKDNTLICDICMEKFIKDNELEREDDFNYWNGMWQNNVGIEK